MSSYFITGKLGSGKTLVAVGRIFDYLKQGRPVASNIDLHLENYLRPQSKKTYIRIPDKPSAEDMHFLGYGNTSRDEEKNGLLVLDELGSWFNSRAWQDKARKPLLDWFIHARKYGWDVLLIVQDIDMVDNQLRSMLGEHLVICKRLDRIKVPLIGGLMQSLGFKGTLPKIHSARVLYGESVTDMMVDRWIYRGTDFYNAYDTKQIFTPDYRHGIFSRLSPWHTTGRYLPVPLSLLDKLDKLVQLVLDPPRPVADLKPKHLLVERIQRLPDPALRLEFFHRFQACGAL